MATSFTDLDLETISGIFFLCSSKSKSDKNNPIHSMHLASKVVQEDLISLFAETNISILLSISPEDSATPLFASLVDASINFFISSSDNSGHSEYEITPNESFSASGNLSINVRASGVIRPDCKSESLSTKFFVEIRFQYNSSII